MFTPYEASMQLALARIPAYKSDKYFANQAYDKVARFEDVQDWIQTGDLALHSGCMPFSFGVRFLTYSRFSHAGIWYRDENGELWIIDVCEGVGGSKRVPLDEIKKHPGRWYWSHVSRRRFPEFKNDKIAEIAVAMQGVPYGYVGIALQWAIHFPIIRAGAYVTKLADMPYFEKRPFCSQAVVREVRKACPSCDPVPDRAEALVTPQDLAQSRLWYPQKTSLYP